MRIGHTRPHIHLATLCIEQPQCVACNTHFTVCHFLFQCDDFLQIRNKYHQVNNMKQLFKDIYFDNIMMFQRNQCF